MISNSDLPEFLEVVLSWQKSGCTFAKAIIESAPYAGPEENRVREAGMAAVNPAGKGVEELAGLIPDNYMMMLVVGQYSGKLETVLANIVDTQVQINEMTKDATWQVGRQLATLMVALMVAPFVFLQSKDSLRNDQENVYYMVGEWVESVVELWPILKVAYPGFLVFIFAAILLSKSVQKQLVNAVSEIPGIKDAVDYWYLGLWAKMVGTSVEAGIGYEDAHVPTENFMPAHLFEGVSQILRRIGDSKGVTGAIDVTKADPRDPRRRVPRLLRETIKAGVLNGDLSEMLVNCSSSDLI